MGHDRVIRRLLGVFVLASAVAVFGQTPVPTAKPELPKEPNPNCDTPNQETKVYRGMEGEMLIDLSDMRLAKIEAKLFRDVAFGWGILGHLDQGGQFVVEQKPVTGGHWEPSHMVLNFTGKV